MAGNDAMTLSKLGRQRRSGSSQCRTPWLLLHPLCCARLANIDSSTNSRGYCTSTPQESMEQLQHVPHHLVHAHFLLNN